MSYKAFHNDIKNNQLAPLYVLYGSEKLMIDRLLEQLVATALNPQMLAFNLIDRQAADLDFSAAMQIVERLPMMDERLIVILREANFINSSQWQLEELERFVDYHKDNPSLTTLLIVDGIDKRKKPYKLLKKVASIYAFETLDETTLAKWMMREVKSFGKTMDMALAIQLAERTGYHQRDSKLDLYAISHLLQRICHLSTDQKLSGQVVDEVIDNSLEANIFKMIDALFEGRAALAYKQLERLAASGEVPIKISFMIHRHIRQLLRVKHLSAQGYSAKAIADALGIKPFVVKKSLSQLKSYGLGDLNALLDKAVTCDLMLKSSLDSHAVLQNFMAEILLIKAA